MTCGSVVSTQLIFTSCRCQRVAQQLRLFHQLKLSTLSCEYEPEPEWEVLNKDSLVLVVRQLHAKLFKDRFESDSDNE